MKTLMTRLRCLFGRHEFVPSVGMTAKFKRGASWHSFKRTHYRSVLKTHVKYYYCIHCHKKVSVSEMKPNVYNI